MHSSRALLPLLSMACVDLDSRVETVTRSWCDQPRKASVDCVYDGDTVYLGSCDRDQAEVIRLLGVDAPEVATSSSTADCYGDESQQFVEEVMVGREVELRFDVECVDIYERTLAWLVLEVDPSDPLVDTIDDLTSGEPEESEVVLDVAGDGTLSVLLNALIVRAGFAPVYDEAIAENVRYETRLDDAQIAAEEAGDGLWTACASR